MNNLSLSILTIVHYSVVVRDTLEYALNRQNYSKSAYDFKKRAIKVEIEQPTALKHFVDSNKEKLGQQIIDEVNNLYNEVYGDDSTIVVVVPDKEEEIRVDQSQHLAIYDVVLPLYDDVKKVIYAHINFARQNNQLEPEIVEIVNAGEHMYRGVAFLCLFNDLEKLFVEYNKARSEAKGEITPQSNFIQQELKQVTDHLNFVRDNQVCRDVDYWEMVDNLFKLMDECSGKRELSKNAKFNERFAEVKKVINDHVSKYELKFKEVFEPAMRELVEKSRANNGKISVEGNGQNNEGNSDKGVN